MACGTCAGSESANDTTVRSASERRWAPSASAAADRTCKQHTLVEPSEVEWIGVRPKVQATQAAQYTNHFDLRRRLRLMQSVKQQDMDRQCTPKWASETLQQLLLQAQMNAQQHGGLAGLEAHASGCIFEIDSYPR